MADNKNIQELIRQHNLEASRIRQLVLSAFVEADHALSQKEIADILQDQYDQRAVNRVLYDFSRKGLIHEVPDPSSAIRYALCESCGMKEQPDDHIHFFCEKCGSTYCMDNINIPSVQLPGDFMATTTRFIVEGLCNKCQ